MLHYTHSINVFEGTSEITSCYASADEDMGRLGMHKACNSHLKITCYKINVWALYNILPCNVTAAN